jgi:hypothetical protein
MGTKVLEIHIGLPQTLGYSNTHLKVHVSTPSSRGLTQVFQLSPTSSGHYYN